MNHRLVLVPLQLERKFMVVTPLNSCQVLVQNDELRCVEQQQDVEDSAVVDC